MQKGNLEVQELESAKGFPWTQFYIKVRKISTALLLFFRTSPSLPHELGRALRAGFITQEIKGPYKGAEQSEGSVRNPFSPAVFHL